MRAAWHRWGLLATLAVSLLGHLALSSLMRRARPVPRRESGPQVEFELLAGASPPPQAPPDPRPATPEPASRSTRANAAARPAAARATKSSPEPVAEAASLAPGPDAARASSGPAEADTAAPAPSVAATPGLDLSPRGVALAQIDTPPTACAPAESSTCPADGLAPDPAAALARSLDRSANGVPHLAPRPPPRVRRKSDGSYVYDGVAFSAAIDPDGTVHFEDHVGGIGPLGFSFDITDFVEKYLLDKPIYAAEKRWFLEHTAEVRRGLADRERDEILARAKRRLRGRLLRVLEDEQLSARAKRRIIFRLWDECAAEGAAADAKALIVEFVRREMPRGSALGYGDTELAELNRIRASLEPFAPYGDG